jgi:hypothetical protein
MLFSECLLKGFSMNITDGNGLQFRLKRILPVLVIAILAGVSIPKSLIGDEALTVTLCGETFSTMVKNVAQESHVPGYHALLWIWIRAFGDSLFSLRLFAFLPVGFLVYAGCRHFNRYGYLILAVSPFLLHLGVEVRMYGLLAALGMCILICLQKLWNSFSVKNFVLLIIICMAGVWVHYFAWCGVAAAATQLFFRKRKRQAVLLVASVLISIAPWLPNLGQQIQRFDPDGESASIDLFQLATPAQRVLGAPFSVAGTLLRFASGNAVFHFNLFSIRSMSIWTIAGILLFAATAFSAWKGRREAGYSVFLMLLFVLIPISFLRPSARHFAMAYPAFAALVIAGLEGKGRVKQMLRILIPVLSLLLCIPFILRSTMPYRSSFNRDYREAAIIAGTAAEAGSGNLVLFLDTHTLAGVLYHLDDEGFENLTITHPHKERFAQGWFFYVEPEEILSYLMQNTDSLVQEWGSDFYLLANDPTLARGPLYGEANPMIGRHSDSVADLDLIECLERYYAIERIPLPHSEGPFSLFHVTALTE